MIFYKAPDNSVHSLDSREFENLLPVGSVEISKAEAEVLAAAAHAKWLESQGL